VAHGLQNGIIEFDGTRDEQGGVRGLVRHGGGSRRRGRGRR
jgi:hypothetical protein